MPANDFFSYAPGAARDAGPSGVTPPPAGEAERGILTELSDEEWEKFIGFAARRRYPAGASVVARGEAAVPLGFVASGAVSVRPERGPATRRGEGEAFGILGFLDGRPSEVAIVADGATEVLLLGREALVQLAAWQPRIAVALLRDLGALVATRLRRLQPAD
jgi:signal-transduction protein with cAMP-binding, CBS, and nucleotidyltransferase domain